jgi:hypothetical protein
LYDSLQFKQIINRNFELVDVGQTITRINIRNNAN